MRTLFVYLVLFLFLSACKQSEDAENTSMMIETVDAAAPVMKSVSSYDPEGGSIETIQPKIIKTSTLRFETPDLAESFLNVQKAMKQHKATLQNDISGKDYESVFRNITVRVPSASFDDFIADISKGVNHFDRKEISAQDVTEEYIDVEARLNAKRVLEKRYFELLNKATKITEMLEIEKQLSTIREEIEAKEGRLKYLQNQVSMSTVHLEMYTNNASESGATASYFGKMWNAVKEGFNNIASFFLGLLHIWPFILIFVIGFVFLRRRFRRKTT